MTSKNWHTMSVTVPNWVFEFYEEYQWEVKVRRSWLTREILTQYAKAKIAERAEASHPSPGPFEDSDTEDS